MKLLLAFLMTAVIVVAACAPQQPLQHDLFTEKGQSKNVTECVADSDCGIGGCSGQVCTTAAEAPGLITTCEYRAEYDCLKLTGCGCVSGKCAWKETSEYNACVETKTKGF